MIETKQDYLYYLKADRIALNIPPWPQSMKYHLFHRIWKYERLLRKEEYLTNCKRGRFWGVYRLFIEHRKSRLGLKLGAIGIPANVFGPGLSIAHHGPINISERARVGKNCRIHNCVTIGDKDGNPCDENAVPTIGDNVFIGPCVSIFGKVTIPDNVAIGANSVVNKSFYEPNITIAGVPAKKVSEKGSGRTHIEGIDLFH